MKFKRYWRNSVPCRILTFGMNPLLIRNLIIILSSASGLLFNPVGGSRHQRVFHSELIFIGLAAVQGLNHADASAIPSPQEISPSYFSKNETSPETIFPASDNATLHSNPAVNQDDHPRRLTELPKSRSKKISKRKMRQAPESAMNRARLLLGSLNRQNCFAKVLCGLGAREPTTKTGLLNDYVYLMEEFVIDDEPDDPKPKSKTKKRKKTKKKKVHTKKDKDDSDSSMSKSDEDDKKDDLDEQLTDWNFLADATLAQDDPQVLKYVQLEEKRRQFKDQLPDDLILKRSGRVEPVNGTEDSKNQGGAIEEPIQLILPPKSNLRLARQMADEVRAGRTFGGSRRQCRTLFRDQCPFDDIQMAEIITNLRKMLAGRGPQQLTGSASKTTTTVTTNGAPGGQVQTISQPQSGGGGSKVEIILHLNQNGMPYGGYQMPMPMAMPMPFNQQFHPQRPQISVSNTTQPNPGDDLAPPHPPWPQLQLGGTSDPRYPLGHPGMMYPPSYYPPPPTTTTTTTTTTPEPPTTTTIRSPGEEQLLDFLYGVVNFNESATDPEIVTNTPTTKQNTASTNPYWSAANIALNQAEDVEHELKIRDRDKDDDSKSRSSEEEELKVYIKSLKHTLKGLAQMNNVTIPPEEEKGDQHSSEEQEPKDSSQEDVPTDDFFGVADEATSAEDGEDDNEEDDESEEDPESTKPTKTAEKVPKRKKGLRKKKVVPSTTKPPPLTLIAVPSSTIKPSTSTPTPRPAEQLFDPDNDDNMDAAVKKLIQRNEPKLPGSMEDDEYEPEDNTSSATSGEADGDFDESDENTSTIPKDVTPEQKEDDLHDLGVSREVNNKRPPPKILLKFEPIPPEKDPEEMTDKERKNLVALSAALLPQVPDTFASTNNHRQPVRDILEEIRIPTAKPILKAFQSVSNIGKHKIINIDEFADDSGKNPVFPRRKKAKKGTRPQKMRYQTRRKPPMRRPLSPKRKIPKKPNHSNSESSEEDVSNGARGDFFQFHSDEGNDTMNPPTHGYSSKTGPLISLPRHPSSGSNSKPQHRPDFYDSLMNYMGMRPVASKKELPLSSQSQYGYGSDEVSDLDHDGGKSDLRHSPHSNSFTKAQLKAQPKIGISIPLEFDMGRDGVEVEVAAAAADIPAEPQGGWGEDKKGEDDGKKKKGDKKDKKKGKDKKKDKKKGKKKGKKKKGKGKKGSGGYAQQFHYQEQGHQDYGLWDKIKVFVDTLANAQAGVGETPFIHLGFSEKDPLDGHPHAVINDKGGSGPSFDKVSYAGGDGDDDTAEEEEEEDDIGEPKKRRRPRPPRPRPDEREEGPDLDNSAAVSGPEYEGIDYDENNEEDSNESPEVVAPRSTTELPPPVIYSPLPASLPTPSQVRQNDVTPPAPTTLPPTTLKTTIVPKPPKYMVDRQQLKIKKKRRKQQKKTANSTTIGPPPPIMLRVTSVATTTTTIPTTTTTEAPTTTPSDGKPPKRRIIYKPPAKRVNINASPPGTPLLHRNIATTTLKPFSSSSLKSTPLDWIKTRVEDDEVEPASHFFQPGPNGQNVVGRPPIPIDAFHTQSEDMLIDTEEDEKLRGGIRGPPRPHRPRPPPPPFFTPYGLRDNTGSGSGSQEADEEGLLQNFPSSPTILIAAPHPVPFQPHVENIGIANPEETRGTRNKKIKNHRTKFRPHSSHRPNEERDSKEESTVTSSVMNSPIFSDYFKHLYSSFGQYLSSSG